MNQRDDLTNELLSAYLDGETSPDESLRAERLLAQHPERRQQLETMRQLGDSVRQLPAHRLDRSFPRRVLAAAPTVDRSDAPARDDWPTVTDMETSVRPWIWPAVATSLFIAASLLFALVWMSPAYFDEVAWQSDAPPAAVPGPTLEDSQPSDSSGRVARTDAAPLPPGHGRPTPSADHRTPSDKTPTLDAPPPTGASGTRTGTAGNPAAVAQAPGTAARSSTPDVSPRASGHAGMVADDQEPKSSAGQPNHHPNVPGGIPARLLLVVDVTVSEQANQQSAFEKQLAASGVVFDGAIKTNQAMEQALLKSRFLIPVPPAAGKGEVRSSDTSAPAATEQAGGVEFVYVVARAGQVDGLWQAMKDRPEWFPTVDLDMAIKPTDMTIFKHLRQAVERQGLASQTPMNDRERQAMIAHRLALPAGWKGGVPARINRSTLRDLPTTRPGGSGNIGSTPLPQRPPRNDRPGQPPARLGQDMIAEILFLVHPAAN